MRFESMPCHTKIWVYEIRPLSAYESLYLKTNDIGVLYQASLLQFEVERDMRNVTQIWISLSKIRKPKAIKLSFNKDENEQQEVRFGSCML
jgi:predicted nucleotidyltransferase